jgi:predicted AAA+ superfamily ATPase
VSPDITHSEYVEKELDQFIARRHSERVRDEGARPAKAPWKKGGYAEERMEAVREAWHEYHCDQAERHRRTLESLIAHHREQASKLLNNPTGGEA